VRQGEKISTAPANPTISPAACQLVTAFWCRTARARTTVHSGVVALMIPAVEQFTVCSATANNRYGTALANSAATAICGTTMAWNRDRTKTLRSHSPPARAG